MRSRLKHSLIAAGVFIALGIGSTVALATVTGKTVHDNPVQDISAAAIGRPGQGVLDPATANMVSSLNARFGSNESVGLRLPSQARVLPGRVDGKRIYIIPTDRGALCVIREADSEACGPPVSTAQPARLVIEDGTEPGASGSTVFGIAMDGVSSISFSVGGARPSIPVEDNLVVFRGAAGTTARDFSNPSATFSDGRIVQLP